MSKKFIYLGILALAITLPISLMASTMLAGDEVSLRADEVITDDVYAAGGSVTSLTTVTGDLIAAGGSLFLSGSTTVDVMVAGGTVNVTGGVGDDLRVAGGTIIINNSIGDDAVVAGGQINILSGAIIGGDLIVMGGKVNIEGVVKGKLDVKAGEVTINGQVLGPTNIKADKIIIGERAILNGPLTYSSKQELVRKEGAQILGEIAYTPIKDTRGGIASIIGLWILLKLLALFVLGLILIKLLKNILPAILPVSQNQSWKNIGIGFLILVVTPILAIIVMFTVIGIPLSILALLLYGFFMLLSCLLAPVVLGSILWKYFNKSTVYELHWKSVLLGVFVSLLLALIPLVGWLINFLLFLLVLGSLSRRAYDRFLDWRNNI